MKLLTEQFRVATTVVGEGGAVSFTKHGKTVEADGSRPILDEAEEAGTFGVYGPGATDPSLPAAAAPAAPAAAAVGRRLSLVGRAHGEVGGTVGALVGLVPAAPEAPDAGLPDVDSGLPGKPAGAGPLGPEPVREAAAPAATAPPARAAGAADPDVSWLPAAAVMPVGPELARSLAAFFSESRVCWTTPGMLEISRGSVASSATNIGSTSPPSLASSSPVSSP